MAKQQQDLQSLINVNTVAPDVNPIASQPTYQKQEVHGGQFQVGAESKQVGRSDEEMKYRGLAQIAGAIGSNMQTFGEIVQREDKRKAGEVENEFDRIDQSNMTPEQKMESLDAVLREVDTPFIGKGWRDKLNLTASRKWLSTDGRNAYEESRYRTELVRFLNEPKNLKRDLTPELEYAFQEDYVRRHPTANANEWFTGLSRKTGAQVNTNLFETQLELLPTAIDLAVQIPDKTQMEQIRLGNTTVIAAFQPFVDIQNKARLQTPELFRDSVYNEIYGLVEKGLDPNLPEDVKVNVLRKLGPHVKTKIKLLEDVLFDDKLIRIDEDYNNSFAVADSTFRHSPYKIDAAKVYISAAMRRLNGVTIPKGDRKALITALGTTIVEQASKAATAGEHLDSRGEFAGWDTMTAYQRVDTVVSLVQRWADEDPDGDPNTPNPNETALMKSLGFEDSVEQLADRSIRITGRQKLRNYLDTEFRDSVALTESVQVYAKETLDRQMTSLKINESVLDSLNSKEAIANAVRIQAETVGRILGVTPDEVKTFYKNNDGSMNPLPNVEAWYRGLSEESSKELQKRGFHLHRLGSAVSLLTGMQMFDVKAYELQQKPGLGGSTFKVDQVRGSLRGYHPGTLNTNQEKKPSWIHERFAGRGGTSVEDVAASNLILQYRAVSTNVMLNGPQRDKSGVVISPGTLSPQELAASEAFLKSVDEGFVDERGNPTYEIRGFVEGINDSFVEITGMLPDIIHQIPRVGPTNPQTPDARMKETFGEAYQMFEDLLSGNTSFDLTGQPNILIDENGTWSPDATKHIIMAGYMSKRSFAIDARKEEKGRFVSVMDAALNRLAAGGNSANTFTYMQTDAGKFDLALLATIGKTYKDEVARTGVNPLIHDGDYMQRRVNFIGDWADASSVADMLALLNSKEHVDFLSRNLRVPAMIASVARGGPAALGTDIISGPITREFVTRNKDALRIASAFGAQVEFATVGDQKSIIDFSVVSVENPTWSPGILVTKLDEALGRGSVTAPLLADAFKGFLGGYTQEEQASMTDHEKIRAAVFVINEATKSRPGALMDTMVMVFGNYGVNSNNLPPDAKLKETKLDLFARLLELSLGIKNPDLLHLEKAGELPGRSGLNPMYINRGTVTHIEPINGGQTPLRQPTLVNAVYGPTYSTTFTASALLQLDENIHNNPNRDRIKKDMKEEFPPATMDVNGAKGEATGLMYTLGVITYSGTVPDSYDARFSVVEHWAQMHGIKSVAQLFGPKGNEIRYFTPGIPNSLDWGTGPAAVALKAGLSLPNPTLKQMLDTINSVYITRGGGVPLFNPSNYNPNSPGGVELRQDQTNPRNPLSQIPSFGFSNRSMDGVPFIQLTDAYYYDEFGGPGGRSDHPHGNLSKHIHDKYDAKYAQEKKDALEAEYKRSLLPHPTFHY